MIPYAFNCAVSYHTTFLHRSARRLSPEVIESRDIGLSCRLDGPGFEVQQGQDSFLFSETARRAVGPSLLFSRHRDFFSGLRRLGRDVDHTSPSSAEVKWSYTSGLAT